MTSAQVVETSVNVISNSPSQDYTHPDDRTLLYDINNVVIIIIKYFPILPMLLTEKNADLHTLLTCSDNIRCGTCHKMRWLCYVLCFLHYKMIKLRNSTHEVLRPSHAQRSLEEMMRVASGNFQECLS